MNRGFRHTSKIKFLATTSKLKFFVIKSSNLGKASFSDVEIIAVIFHVTVSLYWILPRNAKIFLAFESYTKQVFYFCCFQIFSIKWFWCILVFFVICYYVTIRIAIFKTRVCAWFFIKRNAWKRMYVLVTDSMFEVNNNKIMEYSRN